MADLGAKRYFDYHKNSQSTSITFTQDHYIRTHALPYAHQSALHLSEASTAPLQPHDVLERLRSEAKQRAEEIEEKRKRREELEARISRMKFRPGPAEDDREDRTEQALQRKETIRQRSLDCIQSAIRDKADSEERQRQYRHFQMSLRETQEREAKEAQAKAAEAKLSEIQQYRSTLRWQQSQPSLLSTEAWKSSATVNTLGQQYGERYTKKHPKRIFTDPIAYEFPRSPEAVHKEERKKAAVAFFGADKTQGRGLAGAGQLTLQKYIDPGCDKHTGLNFTDTRQLLV
jgi:hypothetical protein